MHHSEPPDLCDDEQTVQKLLVEDDVRAELQDEDPGGAHAGPGGHKVGDCLQYKVKQDLSVKCSACKGFIPCLEWKSPMPKKKYWIQNFIWVH